MADLIINYNFSGNILQNSNGSYRATVEACNICAGPGQTRLGFYGSAYDFNPRGLAYVPFSPDGLNHSEFCARLLFRIDEPVTHPQVLVECGSLSFKIEVDEDLNNRDSDFIIRLQVDNILAQGYAGLDTTYDVPLRRSVWYLLDLVYQQDTLALFINNSLRMVHAFSDGTLFLRNSLNMYLGNNVSRNSQFKGKMAILLIYSGIPQSFLAGINRARTSPQWFITNKYEHLRNHRFPGEKIRALTQVNENGSWLQRYRNGLILYHPAFGAFAMFGPLMSEYLRSGSEEISALGPLISEEIIAGARKEFCKYIFRDGSLYYSAEKNKSTRVVGKIYLAYKRHGEETGFLGFPEEIAQYDNTGGRQEFTKGDIYHKKNAVNAYAISKMSRILDRYLTTGGVETWGYPIHDEATFKDKDGNNAYSIELENCTFYSQMRTGIHEVHGYILQVYGSQGGPLGHLGFPRSNTEVLDSNDQIQYTFFQNGSIVWLGSEAETYVCRPFKIMLKRIKSRQDHDTLSEDDLYPIIVINDLRVNAEMYSHTLGTYNDKNVRDLNYLVTVDFHPAAPENAYELRVKVKDEDTGILGDDDDVVGEYVTTLSIKNAWGLKQTTEQKGLHPGSWNRDLILDWAIQPIISADECTYREYNFWDYAKYGNLSNPITRNISWENYATAFRDVGITNNPFISPWDAIYYEIWVSGAGENGNCFGMCLEAIYAWKNKSIFYRPLSRFSWAEIPMQKEINIKTSYQLGADVLYWLIGGIASGSTHNPLDVFETTKREFAAGRPPIIWISKTLVGLEHSHFLLPYEWKTEDLLYTIKVFDPNVSASTFAERESVGDHKGKEIRIIPHRNQFTYLGEGNIQYNGDQWEGARFYYVPWNLVDSLQHVPTVSDIVTDQIDMIIGGESVATVSITDSKGNNLDARKLAKDQSPKNMFIHLNLTNSSSPAEVLIRKRTTQNSCFIHKIKGQKNGKLLYAYRRKGLSEFVLEGDIKNGECISIENTDMGPEKTQIKCTPGETKIFQLTLFTRNSGGNSIKLSFKNLMVTKEKGLAFNLKPAHEGIDIVGINDKGAVVEVESITAEKIVKKNFKLDGYSAIRLQPINFVANNKLTISSIQVVNGAIRGKISLLSPID